MIEGVPVVAFAPEALLGFTVLLVLTDKLVWHARLKVLQKRIETQDQVIASLTEQNTMMLNSAMPTVDAVLRALGEAAGDRSTS